MAAFPLDLTISRAVNFGPIAITAQRLAEDGVTLEIVPLAGWTAYAEVRKSAATAVVLDLAPVIAADDTIGLITIPEIDFAITAALPIGTHEWDIILQDPSGRRLPPLIAGEVHIDRPITQPSA